MRTGGPSAGSPKGVGSMRGDGGASPCRLTWRSEPFEIRKGSKSLRFLTQLGLSPFKLRLTTSHTRMGCQDAAR